MTDEKDMLAEGEQDIKAAEAEREEIADELTEEGGVAADNTATDDEAVDYEAIVSAELASLSREFPEMRGISSITELENPIRYAELRDLGLSPREAYLATSEKHRRADNRRHLFSAVPAGSGAPSIGMSRAELESARELFPSLGDGELMNLYKKVRA